MASMNPSGVRIFQSPTEEKLYNIFMKDLGDEYQVYYGRRWHDKKINRDPNIECDFIITKPDSGILVLEVKGGRWERRDGYWYCNGEYAEDDNPFDQVIKIKSSLINLLKLNAPASIDYFPLHEVVCLPESRFNDNDISDLTDVLTNAELSYTKEWIESCMQYCIQRSFPTVTNSLMLDHIKRSLMHDHATKLNEILDSCENDLIYLTNDELQLDNNLKNMKRLTIRGCAGTGKTIMALRQVKRLATKKEIKNILFTCFNEELGKWLESQTQSIKDKCTTMPFLRFCEKQAIEGKMIDADLPDEVKNAKYWEEVPGYFSLVNEDKNISFDAVVVDEGQIFRKEWWFILESLLKNKNSYKYIFFDDYQRIYSECENLIPGADNCFELKINIRNTSNIHKHTIKFLPKGDLPECNNIAGEKVKLGLYADKFEMKKLLQKIFHKLFIEGRLKPEDVIILTPKNSRSDLEENEKLGKYKLVQKETKANDAIRYTTIQKFRGMERKVIILTEMDGYIEDFTNLYYMGSSRAKTLLILMMCSDVDLDILKELEINAELFDDWL